MMDVYLCFLKNGKIFVDISEKTSVFTLLKYDSCLFTKLDIGLESGHGLQNMSILVVDGGSPTGCIALQVST